MPSLAIFDDWWSLLRLRQWSKNLVVMVGLLPTGGFLHVPSIVSVFLAAVLFQAAASSGYLFNDAIDAVRDSAHPHKRNRPIASGRVSFRSAISISTILAVAAVAVGLRMFDALFAGILAVYLILVVAYSLILKHIVVMDVVIIATLFVMRAIAGIVVLRAELSPLFLGSVGLLALLLALGKRLNEVRLLHDGAVDHRPVLRIYRHPAWATVHLLVAGATLGCYISAASLSPTALTHPSIIWSALPVMLGIWRYTILVRRHAEVGEPELLLGRDVWMLLSAVSWVLLLALALISYDS